MATQAASHSYVNISTTGDTVSVDLHTAPQDEPTQRYINIPLSQEKLLVWGGSDTNTTAAYSTVTSTTAATTNGHTQDGGPTTAQTHTDTASPSVDVSPGTGSLRQHCSEGGGKFTVTNNTQYDTVSPRSTTGSADQAVSVAKLQLLMRGGGGAGGGGGKSNGCTNCDEMSRLLDMWEIGVSSLTRNYSRILAHLIKTRDASMALEFRLKANSSPSSQRSSINSIGRKSQGSASPPTPARVPKNRQSMFVNNGHVAIASINARDQDLAENMYPARVTHVQPEAFPEDPSPASFPPQCAKDIKDLNSHLEEAIELCQQLAAACFKTNHLSDLTGNRSTSSLHHNSASVRKHSTGSSPSAASLNYEPSLHPIAEMRLSDSLRKRQRTLERVPSAPNLEFSVECSSSSDSHSDNSVDNDFIKIDTPKSSTSRKENGSCDTPTKDHVTEPSIEDDTPPSEHTLRDKGPDGSLACTASERDSGLEAGLDYRPESFLSSTSTYSESDVKCVMSKIATLEEERYKLLETIDTLQEDNSTVRLSLHEIFSDLENKDLQLTLAMQDLSIATGEIKRVADMRRKLDELSRERDLLLEKLGGLEDESSAVKVSLIQLLQEKSATNKTLALENCRLSQRVRQNSVRGAKNSIGESPTPALVPADNVSMHSAYSVATEDSTLHEAYMEAAMSENFVHKQGFLTKQGGRVRNWKKRLFVLNTEGLSYYKTEQPVQTVPIERINKVMICHGHCSQPHMFEVHTQGRTFYLSAPTADEMQSWVGMLQTLKQYNKATTLHRQANKRNQILAEASADQDGTDQDGAGSDTVIISSPERDTPSPDFDDIQPQPSERATGGGSEKEGKQLLHHYHERDLDEDDDTTYLHHLKKGHNMSAPTNLDGGFESGLLASLDLQM